MTKDVALNPDEVLAGTMQALELGDVDTALALSAWLVREHPDAAAAHYSRSAALSASGDEDGGASALNDARLAHALTLMRAEGIEIARLLADPAYALSVARQFYNRFWMGPAIVAAGCAVGKGAPTDNDGLLVLAQALQYQGRSEEAVRAFGQLLQAKPAPYLHSYILYSLLFVRDGVRRHAAEAHNFQRIWADAHTPAAPTFHVARSADRRLKLAYMAPSFSRNQARHFLGPLLDFHDRSRFDVIVYVADAAKEIARDDLTIKSFGHMNYADHAEMIRNDAIDVLVDFHGHASSARPLVFARKPAPVQVSWLNWTHTTGLRAMDYAIHAETMHAGEDAALFTESIWNVGEVIAPFRPDAVAQPSPAPALERGHVVFGAFHHPAKISDETLAAWAAILRRLPTAKLHFKYSCYADPALQMETGCRFMAHGVPATRLEFSGHETGEAYENAFRHIDIHLDSNPVVGGTTTMEALSRGVPVLTLRGGDFYARIGVQGAMALGMPELVAETWDDYVAKAVAMASDIPALGALRERVRPALDASIYRDEPRFTRMMETAYLGMFEAWLDKQRAQAAA